MSIGTLPDQFGQSAVEDLQIMRDGLPDVRLSVKFLHRIEAARRAYSSLLTDADRAEWVIEQLDAICDSVVRGRQATFNPYPTQSWFVPAPKPAGIAKLESAYHMDRDAFLSAVRVERDRYVQARADLIDLANMVRSERVRLEQVVESAEQERRDQIEADRKAGYDGFISALASQVKQQIESTR